MALTDVRSFENYFVNRAAVGGDQPVAGDEILVLRAGTVLRAYDIHNHAALYLAANATATTIAAVDTWTAIGGTFADGTFIADVWSSAANQLTYGGPTQLRPALITATASLTQDQAAPKDFEIGIFVNDVLLQNAMRVSVDQDEVGAVTVNALHVLTTGDVVDMRVRGRTDATDVTVTDAQLVLP